MKNLLCGLIIGCCLIISGFILPKNVFASGSLYLSPATKTVNQGESFSVAVRLSTTDQIVTVHAVLSYPADKLDFVSIDTSGSALNWQLDNTGGGGSVTITRGTLGSPPVPVTGDVLVATIFFRSKQSSGSASVTFTADSGISPTSGVNVLSGTSGGNYNFSAPPTSNPTSTPTSNSKSTSKSTSTSSTPASDTTPPKISDVKVSATSFKGATIEWKTDEAASSIVEYGLSTKYDLSAEGAGATKDHKVSFTSTNLIPGLVFHFRVKSTDAAGNLATSQDFTFKTKGYSIQIKVVEPTGNPVSGVKVRLYPGLEEGTTDKDGLVKFEDISLGKHVVELKLGDATASDKIDVKDSKDTQAYQLTAFAGRTTLGGILQISVLGGVLVLFVALIAVFVLWWRRHEKLKTLVSDVTDSEKPNLPNLSNK